MRHLNIERSMSNQLQMSRDNFDKTVAQLNEKIDALAKENETLAKWKNQIHEINNRNEECLDYQVSKLADLNLEISKLRLDAESQRLKCHQLVNEQIVSMQTINDLNDQLHSIKAENKRQVEKLIYDYELKLKQLPYQEPLVMHEQRNTRLSSLKLDDREFEFQQVHRDSDVSNYQLDHQNGSVSIRHKESSLMDVMNDIREKTQSAFSNKMTELTTGQSNRQINNKANAFSKRQLEPLILIEEKDETNFLNGSIAEAEFRLLEEKDEEITQLNKKIIELQTNQKSIENTKLKETHAVLELEVRQLKEQINLLKDNEKKIIRENQNFVSKMIQEKILKVQELTMELADMENENAD